MRARRWTAGVVGALALIMGACSPGEVHEEQSTPTPTGEELFIERVRETVPEVREASDDIVLEVGQTACAALEGGATVGDLALVVGSQTTPEEAQIIGQIHATAVFTLCPDVLETGD